MSEVVYNPIENVRGDAFFGDDILSILNSIKDRVALLLEQGFEILDIIYAPDSDTSGHSITVYYN